MSIDRGTDPSDVRVAAVSEVLAAALPAAASRLGMRDGAPVESDLKAVLRETLDGRLRGMTLGPHEHKVSLDGWPKVGPVDLAIALPDGPPVLIELKWGSGTLYNCAWDAAKLALAVATGVTIAGPTVSLGRRSVPGPKCRPSDGMLCGVRSRAMP